MTESENIKIRKKIGLALGGGGWKGIAHVGVLKVLEKNNIPIDLVTGASAGSLIGGLYSYFGNSEDLEKFILKFGYRDLLKITADPEMRTGLLKGKRMIEYLNKITGKANIEDLKIPFCAVASDLISGKSVYIKKGNLAEAIKASSSVPLVFEPTKKDGMYLIDGGATENIPVQCAKEMGADFVIAVNLNTNFFPIKEEDVKSSPRIVIVSTRVILNRLSEILAKDADILIEPKITKKGVKFSVDYFLKFVREKEIIKVGEEETLKFIPKIIKLMKS